MLLILFNIVLISQDDKVLVENNPKNDIVECSNDDFVEQKIQSDQKKKPKNFSKKVRNISMGNVFSFDDDSDGSVVGDEDDNDEDKDDEKEDKEGKKIPDKDSTVLLKKKV